MRSVLSRQGFVDPVFVDHEDSQHAADLDTLVFDIGKHEQEVGKSLDVFQIAHCFFWHFKFIPFIGWTINEIILQLDV